MVTWRAKKFVLRNQGRLSKHRKKYREVQSRSPEPMSGVKAGRLLEISPEEYDGEAE